MTVETSVNRSGPYLITPGVLAFARTFKALDESHVKVIHTSTAGAESELTTGFSQTGIGDDDGEVIFSSGALPSSGSIVLLRRVPSVQETDYSDQSRVAPSQVERDLDLVVMQLQDLREASDRSLKLPVTETGGATVTLPGDGETLIWDEASGGFVAGPHVTDIVGAVAAAESIKDAAFLQTQVFMTLPGVLRYTHDRNGAELDVSEGNHQLFGPFGRMVYGDDYVIHPAGGILFLGEPKPYDPMTVDRVARFDGGEMQFLLDGLADAVRGAGIVYPSRADAVAAIPLLPESVMRVSWNDGFGISSVSRQSGFGGIPDMPGWRPVENTVKSFNGNIVAAFASDPERPVDFGSELWANDSYAGYRSVYGINGNRKAMRSRVQVGRLNASGRAATWTETPDPIDVLVKVSKASRASNPSAWDQTQYVGLIKDDGDAFGASFTAAAQHVAGSGDLIAGHHRAIAYHAGAEIFATWSYVSTKSVTDDHVVDAIGHEINLALGFDAVWDMPVGKGDARGLIVNTADGGKRGHTAIYVGRHPGTGGWLQGLRIRGGAIADDEGGTLNSRAMTIEGALYANERYMGLVFEDGNYRNLIDMSRVSATRTVGEAALTLPAVGRMRWGDPTSGKYVAPVADGSNLLNFQNYAIAMNGVKVLGLPSEPVANATDAASAITQLNLLLAVCREQGFLKTA